ncbi:hypothetical protein VE02_02520 [Pseudogymnoascus sp. 03VT05]|nr:hypothetical protein VE02_02520 [Pseudogymnoascus sp. 03VT05]
MAPIKLDDNAAYMAYKLLTERPLGMKPFGKDEEGFLIVRSGELFCRKDVMTEQERYDAQLLGDLEFRLCEARPHWEFEGSPHWLSQGQLAEVRKGTNSAHHVRESAKFFETTMRNHDLHVKANAPGKAVSDYGDDDATNTPQKEKPHPRVAPRRPFLPVKKDGSAHKAKMRQVSTITHKCNGCKKAKEKICPPTTPTDACDVWNFFTDDEMEEEEKEEIVSSPLSATQTISDDEDEDDEESQ